MLNRLVEGMRDAGAEVKVVNLREGKKGVVPISYKGHCKMEGTLDKEDDLHLLFHKVDHPLLD